MGPFENQHHSKQFPHRVKMASGLRSQRFLCRFQAASPRHRLFFTAGSWQDGTPLRLRMHLRRVQVPRSRCPEGRLLTPQTQGQAGDQDHRPTLGGPTLSPPLRPLQPIHLAGWATTLCACHAARRPPCVCPPGGSGGSPMWCPCPAAPPAPHVLCRPGAKMLGSRRPRVWPRPRSSLPNSEEAELQTPGRETESQSVLQSTTGPCSCS